MYFVYALSSLNYPYIYVGLSANLKDRIKRHNSGYERTTKPYAPFQLIYFEVLEDRLLRAVPYFFPLNSWTTFTFPPIRITDSPN